MEVIYQPVFYLFISFSVMLSLTYFWGSRRNKKIYLSAFNSIRDILKPKDEEYINIGGLTGYHAVFRMKGNSSFSKVEATITLLPRQSFLYFPISRYFMRFDRLFIAFGLRNSFEESISETHLIEKKFSTFKTARITNPEDFSIEERSWGEKQFLIYYKDETGKNFFNSILKSLEDPGEIRHIAVVPEHKRIFVFMLPVYGKVGQCFERIFPWIKSYAP